MHKCCLFLKFQKNIQGVDLSFNRIWLTKSQYRQGLVPVHTIGYEFSNRCFLGSYCHFMKLSDDSIIIICGKRKRWALFWLLRYLTFGLFLLFRNYVFLCLKNIFFLEILFMVKKSVVLFSWAIWQSFSPVGQISRRCWAKTFFGQISKTTY